MARKHRFESDALDYLYNRYIGEDPKRREKLEQELINLDIAQKIYDLRKEAGLTQKALAKKVGTTASVISRLESADYDGHSLSMLQRIASALDMRVEVTFVPLEGDEAA